MEEFSAFGREVNKAHCSCGGEFKEVEATDKEEKAHGCSSKGCCVRAIQCSKCGTRITFQLCAPEWDID